MKRLPTHIIDYCEGCFVAGGAILSIVTKSDIADYDLYPKTYDDAIDVCYALVDSKDYFIVNISDKAITFKSNVDLDESGKRCIVQVMIYDEFKTPEQIFENFDFTVCMGAFDGDTKKYTFHEDFLIDIASNSLRFNHRTKYPLNSLLRISKYREKGYYISKPEMIRMILTAVNAGLPTSWHDLESQIGGTYGKILSLSVDHDKEFTFETMLEELGNINTDMSQFEQDNSDDYQDIKLVDLESVIHKRMSVARDSADSYRHVVKLRVGETEYNTLGSKVCLYLQGSIELPDHLLRSGSRKMNDYDISVTEFTTDLFGIISCFVEPDGTIKSSMHSRLDPLVIGLNDSPGRPVGLLKQDQKVAGGLSRALIKFNPCDTIYGNSVKKFELIKLLD